MQTRARRPKLEKVNPKIKKSCKKNQKEKREKNRRMANQRAQVRALKEYGVPSLTGSQNCIVSQLLKLIPLKSNLHTFKWFHSINLEDYQ